MTKLDLHIVKEFLARYIIVLSGILGLYVIIDCMEKLPAITRQPTAGEALRVGLLFYLSHSPLIVIDFAPGFSLLAGVWTLSGILRRNELMAMQTSGISSRRALSALVLVTVLPGLLFWFGQDWFGSVLLHPYLESELEVRNRDHLADLRDIIVKDHSGRTFTFRSYRPRTGELEEIWVLPAPGGKRRISASRGAFTREGILLRNAHIWQLPPGGQSRVLQSSLDQMTVQTDLSEEILLREKLMPEFMSSRELRLQASHLDGWPEARSLRIELHRRIADIVATYGLVMLSLPIVVAIAYRLSGMSLSWWITSLLERMVPILIFAAFYGIKLAGLAVSMSRTDATVLGLLPAAWGPALFVFLAGLAVYSRARF